MGSLLFNPIHLRDLTLDNRIVVPPMAQYSALSNGAPSAWHMVHLGTLAISGAGLVIVEATGVEPRGRVTLGCLGLWSEEQAEAFAPLMAFCREHSQAKVGIQLAHAGRKGSFTRPWEQSGMVDIADGGWQPIGPSDTPYPGRAVPAALDEAELERIKASFADAARRADRVGFDLIEIHNAHGYLLHSFLSPLSNKRSDRYGGDLEGRMRFPLEVFKATREAWPDRKPLGVRVSATDWAEGGWDLDDTVAFAKELKRLGCDFVVASGGGLSPDQKITPYPGYQIPFAAKIREEAEICTMGVGLITEPRQAEEVLQKGSADMVALGREMLRNPRWPWRAASELNGAIHRPPQLGRGSKMFSIEPQPVAKRA